MSAGQIRALKRELEFLRCHECRAMGWVRVKRRNETRFDSRCEACGANGQVGVEYERKTSKAGFTYTATVAFKDD
jgi:hypothetical protein